METSRKNTSLVSAEEYFKRRYPEARFPRVLEYNYCWEFRDNLDDPSVLSLWHEIKHRSAESAGSVIAKERAVNEMEHRLASERLKNNFVSFALPFQSFPFYHAKFVVILKLAKSKTTILHV